MAMREPEASGVEQLQSEGSSWLDEVPVVEEDRAPEQIEEERRVIEEWEAAGRPTVSTADILTTIDEMKRSQG